MSVWAGISRSFSLIEGHVFFERQVKNRQRVSVHPMAQVVESSEVQPA